MENQFQITRTNRNLLLKILDNHSLEELNKIPEGFKNNIIWNIAHVVATQQLLVYKLSGLPMILADDFVEKYKKGSQPKEDINRDEALKIRELLLSSLVQLEKDYEKGIFTEYQAYETSTGFVIHSVDEAIAFNNFHEGIHFGYILALRKSL